MEHHHTAEKYSIIGTQIYGAKESVPELLGKEMPHWQEALANANIQILFIYLFISKIYIVP